MDSEIKVPFETGMPDPEAANMLEVLSIGKWNTDAGGLKEALEEKPTLRDLFSQMKKDRLLDAAEILNETADGLPFWGADKKDKSANYWPGITALRAMKKAELVNYLAEAFERALLVVFLRLEFEDAVLILQIAEQENVPLIRMDTLKSEDHGSDENNTDVLLEYGQLVFNNFLISKRLHQSGDACYYGMYLPEEIRAFLNQNRSDLLMERMFLDILNFYAQASVSLYGVITLDDLFKVIRRYERMTLKNNAASGDSTGLGSMIQEAKRSGDLVALRSLIETRKVIAQNLMELSPQKLMVSVEMTCGDDRGHEMIPLLTDGEIVQVLINEDLIARAEDDDELWETAHELLSEQQGKPRYYPGNLERFFQYALSMLNDDVPALANVSRLAVWLSRKHRNEIVTAIRRDRQDPSKGTFQEPYPDESEASVQKAANEISAEVYHEIAAATFRQAASNTGLHTLEKRYDLLMNNLSEMKEYLVYMQEINSNARLFANNGNTPSELRALRPAHQGPTELIFGPGMQGTGLPKLVQEAIRDHSLAGNFIVNDDEVKRASKKVGRNDPCPCGSGKKYKRCCGKKN